MKFEVRPSDWHYRLLSGNFIGDGGSISHYEIKQMNDCQYIRNVVMKCACIALACLVCLGCILFVIAGLLFFLWFTWFVIFDPSSLQIYTTGDTIYTAAIVVTGWSGIGAFGLHCVKDTDWYRHSKYNPSFNVRGLPVRSTPKKAKTDNIFIQRLKNWKQKVCTQVNVVDPEDEAA